jgi:calcineurin-like phosphoesterase family protein
MDDFLVTADQHFGHQGILKRGRPFQTVEDMDDAMIERHNKRVGKKDHVFFVGDFSGSNDEKYLRKIFHALNGQKHLIPGNHDTKQVLNLPWATPVRLNVQLPPGHDEKGEVWEQPVRDSRVIKQGGRKFILQHFAPQSWDQMYNGAYLLYGHTHGKLPGRGRSIDVGVDSWGYQPITPDEAIAAMKKYNPDFNDYIPELERIQRYFIHEDDQHLIVDDGLDGKNYLEQNLRLEEQLGGKTVAQTRPQPEMNLFEHVGLKL